MQETMVDMLLWLTYSRSESRPGLNERSRVGIDQFWRFDV